MELGVHREAAAALMVAQVHLGHVFHHLVGLPEGERLTDHDGLREDFDEAADAVVGLVTAEGIVEEPTRTHGL